MESCGQRQLFHSPLLFLTFSDCGQYLNGVGLGSRYDGTFPGVTTVTGNCADWTDATTWSAAKKAQFATLAGAWIDATQVRLPYAVDD